MSKKRHKLSDQIRRAVDKSGLSRYVICQASGIDQGSLSRFMAGKVGLSMPTLDALGEILGLELVATGRGPEVPMRGRGRPRKAR